MTTLETKIFDFIEDSYEAKFLGKVKVNITTEELIPFEYTLQLTLNNYMIPLYISMQTDNEDKFYNYICKELQQRNLPVVKHFKLIKNDTNDDQDIVYK